MGRPPFNSLPGTNHSNGGQHRNSTLHADAQAMADEVRVFLFAHSEVSQRVLCRTAGLGTTYVYQLLRGDHLEINSRSARQLRAAMKRLERDGKAA